MASAVEADEAEVPSNDDEPTLDDLRQMGNHSFAKGNYDNALALYSTAVERAREAVEHCDDAANNDALILNLCNRSACLFKMEQFEDAQRDAEEAVEKSRGK
jgi:tetratricopeptide (TPR) repeat protein